MISVGPSNASADQCPLLPRAVRSGGRADLLLFEGLTTFRSGTPVKSRTLLVASWLAVATQIPAICAVSQGHRVARLLGVDQDPRGGLGRGQVIHGDRLDLA